MKKNGLPLSYELESIMDKKHYNGYQIFSFGEANAHVRDILKREVEASKTYQHLLLSSLAGSLIDFVKQAKLNHESAILYWRKQIQGHVRQDASEKGVWPEVLLVTSLADSQLVNEKLGNALKEGELSNYKNYLKLLESEKLASSQKKEIRETFLPRQLRHIGKITSLIQSCEAT